MRLARLLGSSLTGSVFAALVPITALLVLQPADYGRFSVAYLIFGFGTSLHYSVISDAWLRLRRGDASDDDGPNYTTALAALSALLAAAALPFLLIDDTLRPLAAVYAAAILFAVYRNGARYRALALDKRSRVALADAFGIAAFAVGLGVPLALGTDGLLAIGVAWLAGCAASALVFPITVPRSGTGPLAWLRHYHRTIRPLLADSLLMDLGAIGTPLLLAGFMRIADFGVYRAVSNLGLPVRLILDPLRPTIGTMSPDRLFRMRPTVGIIGASVLLAVLCYLALVLVVPLAGSDLGTLPALVAVAAPCAVYVAGTSIGSLYYVVCRVRCTQGQILFGRITQTVIVVAMPLGGLALAGLTGAVWGFAASALLSGIVWMLLAARQRGAA